MNEAYFSDREKGPRPRIEEEITDMAWGGIWSYLERLISQNAFAQFSPSICEDSTSVISGTNIAHFRASYQAEIPELPDQLGLLDCPSTLGILDLIEFCHRHVAIPGRTSFHKYFNHDHLFEFDAEASRSEFREQINLIFARNGLAYELSNDGRVVRLAPVVLGELLKSSLFDTGDKLLDQMLEDARSKFLSPELKMRRESLEKLWDAWERIKTLEPGDKKQSATKMLEIAAPEEKIRERLQLEATELTWIGNNFMIRHSETNKTPIEQSEHVDYLFHRMFAIVYLFLSARQKGSQLS